MEKTQPSGGGQNRISSGPLDQRITMASILSVEPPIIYVRPRPVPFGLAGAIAERSRGRPFICIARTMWTLEEPHQLFELSFIYRRFRQRFPHIRLIVAANTEAELRLLEQNGVETIFANHNMFVDERMFKPMPDAARTYDAIYNACFSPFKRRWLCMEIERCAHLGYVADPDQKGDPLGAFLAAKADLPHHDFLNPVSANKARRLGAREVNQVLARAAVGLCLSEAEGAMVASVEYLLAGLPVVTTPNLGGRDRYFTAETAIVAEPNPRAIRDAVMALKARNIPRSVVRRITLELVRRDREAFNSFIGGLRQGFEPIRNDPRWSFNYVNNLCEWGKVSDFATRLGLPPAASQETPPELLFSGEEREFRDR